MKSKIKLKQKVRKPIENEYVADRFDKSVVIDYCKDVCVLCKEGHVMGLILNRICNTTNNSETNIGQCEEDINELYFAKDNILDRNLIWASQYSLGSKSETDNSSSTTRARPPRRVFVHFYCALYSPQSYFHNNTWYNLKKEIYRSRLFCAVCGKFGSTLGCKVERCKFVAHIPCALRCGFKSSRFNQDFLCPEHIESRNQLELHKDAKVSFDLSKGRESVPIRYQISQGNESKLLNAFEYTTQNYDSDEVMATKIMNVNELQNCCDCTGLCDDVNKCSCLKLNGRSYTSDGLLIPTKTQTIFECNLKCNCSIRRCTNRVVERGLIHRFEVFELNEFSSTQSYSVGVRTLDNIKANEFICEMTGQYRTGEAISTEIRQGSVKGSDVRFIPIRNWNDSFFGNEMRMVPLPNESSSSIKKRKLNDSSRIIELDEDSIDVQETDRLDDAVDNVQKVRMDSTIGSSPNSKTVANLLESDICLDCRTFGNIGRFIRNRLASSRKTMIQKRLIYVNSNAPEYPKLALFAACFIPANTELFLS